MTYQRMITYLVALPFISGLSRGAPRRRARPRTVPGEPSKGHLTRAVLVLGVALGTPLVSAIPRAEPQDLQTVLTRAGEYVRRYQNEFSLLVADEHYVQKVRYATAPGEWTTAQVRNLISEFALVRVDQALGARWMGLRDVVEVDGRAVADRGERLQRLFRQSPSQFDRAMAISRESARYNVGTLRRTVNVPTVALEFFEPRAQRRLRFSDRGEETVQDGRVRVVEFEEWERPTIIRTPEGANVVTAGVAWIEPDSGRLVRTELDPQPRKGLKTRITVTYAPDARLELWVPVDMKELYEAESEQIVGEATYTRYRRFETDVKLTGPKGG